MHTEGTRLGLFDNLFHSFGGPKIQSTPQILFSIDSSLSSHILFIFRIPQLLNMQITDDDLHII